MLGIHIDPKSQFQSLFDLFLVLTFLPPVQRQGVRIFRFFKKLAKIILLYDFQRPYPIEKNHAFSKFSPFLKRRKKTEF